MSDLLTRFVVALESIATTMQGAKVGVTPKPDKAETTTDDSAAKAAAKADAAKKAEAAKAAEAKKAEAAKAAATSGGKGAATTPPAPAGTTKAPGGKRTLDDIRSMVRKVATTEGLGKPDAINILEEEGGVKTVAELKPENYDAVYEACEAAIAGAGKPPAAADGVDDLM